MSKSIPKRKPDLILPETSSHWSARIWFEENIQTIIIGNQENVSATPFHIFLDALNTGSYHQWTKEYEEYLEKAFHDSVSEELK